MNPPSARLFPALLLMAFPALAAERPVTLVSPDAICHRSIREAAEAGIQVAAERDRRIEYGGAIFEREPLCFLHSEPVTSLRRDRVEYVIRQATGMTLVAIFHTHTPGGHDGEFSAGDRLEQQRLGVSSYLGIIGARRRNLVIRVLGEMEFAQSASTNRNRSSTAFMTSPPFLPSSGLVGSQFTHSSDTVKPP